MTKVTYTMMKTEWRLYTMMKEQWRLGNDAVRAHGFKLTCAQISLVLKIRGPAI